MSEIKSKGTTFSVQSPGRFSADTIVAETFVVTDAGLLTFYGPGTEDSRRGVRLGERIAAYAPGQWCSAIAQEQAVGESAEIVAVASDGSVLTEQTLGRAIEVLVENDFTPDGAQEIVNILLNAGMLIRERG